MEQRRQGAEYISHPCPGEMRGCRELRDMLTAVLVKSLNQRHPADIKMEQEELPCCGRP